MWYRQRPDGSVGSVSTLNLFIVWVAEGRLSNLVTGKKHLTKANYGRPGGSQKVERYISRLYGYKPPGEKFDGLRTLP